MKVFSEVFGKRANVLGKIYLKKPIKHGLFSSETNIMGNTKLKSDEEWSQEDLGDELFDSSYENDQEDDQNDEIEAQHDAENDLKEQLLEELKSDAANLEAVQSQMDQPEAGLQTEPAAPEVQTGALSLETSPAVFDLDFMDSAENDMDIGLEVQGLSDLPPEDSDALSHGEGTTLIELSGDFPLDEPTASEEESVEIMPHSSIELIGDNERLDINDALPEKDLGEVVASGGMDFDAEDMSQDAESDFDLEQPLNEAVVDQGESVEEPGLVDEGPAQFEDSSYDELSEQNTFVENVAAAGSIASDAVVGGEAEEPDVSEPSIQDSNYDWRKYVGMRSAPQGTPKDLITKAFANDLEKHLGLQVVSLLSGERSELHNWKYAVWSDGSLRNYSHDGRGRVSGKITEEILRTDIRSAVFSLAPLLIQLHNSHFDFVEYLKSQKKSPKKIQSLRKPLAWNGPELSAFGFHAYAGRMQSRNYQAFHFEGLGEQIFYDGRSRSVYFDLSHYATKPQSWLLYGVLTKIWALRMGYLPFVTLDVMDEMLPSIEKVKSELGGKKSFFNFKKSAAAKFLKSHYGKKVEMYANQIQAIQTDQMFSVTNAMNLHIYKLLLADGLDLVGLLNYILKTDITAQTDAASVMQTHQNKYEVMALFEFAASLDFS